MLTKVIEQSKIDHFTKWFDRADKIVIVSHVGPDGDAIGSSLGLWHFFSSQGKTANVIVPSVAVGASLLWHAAAATVAKHRIDVLINFITSNVIFEYSYIAILLSALVCCRYKYAMSLKSIRCR